MGVIDKTSVVATPVSRAAAIAWRGYMADVEQLPPNWFASPADLPSFDDAVNNTMGDRLQGFVLIEATEVAEGQESLAGELEETALALRASIQSLEAAYAEVRRVQALEEMLSRSPRAFGPFWGGALRIAAEYRQCDLLDILERASGPQQGSVTPRPSGQRSPRATRRCGLGRSWRPVALGARRVDASPRGGAVGRPCTLSTVRLPPPFRPQVVP